MDGHVYPEVSKELAQKRRELAPDIYGAFRTFSQRVFADGAETPISLSVPPGTKKLVIDPYGTILTAPLNVPNVRNCDP